MFTFLGGGVFIGRFCNIIFFIDYKDLRSGSKVTFVMVLDILCININRNNNEIYIFFNWFYMIKKYICYQKYSVRKCTVQLGFWFEIDWGLFGVVKTYSIRREIMVILGLNNFLLPKTFFTLVLMGGGVESTQVFYLFFLPKKLSLLDHNLRPTCKFLILVIFYNEKKNPKNLVQKVVTHFKLPHKMGHFFLDTQYIQRIYCIYLLFQG